MLGLTIDAPARLVRLAPALPPRISRLRLETVT